MEHAKKMALVEPRLIDSLVRPTYPLPSTVKAINSLDREMESILRNTALSDDDKVRQYQRIMERYLTFHDQYQNAQIPVAPSAAATPRPLHQLSRPVSRMRLF